MVTLEIAIPVPSEWPTRGELVCRNRVEDALNAAGVGTVSGVGGGMGNMDVAYRLDDETKIPAARTVIAEAMKSHMANFQYKVSVR
jgi:hypothetical protein